MPVLPAGLAPTPFPLTLRLRLLQPIARRGLAAITTGLGAAGLQLLDPLFEDRELLAQYLIFRPQPGEQLIFLGGRQILQRRQLSHLAHYGTNFHFRLDHLLSAWVVTFSL